MNEANLWAIRQLGKLSSYKHTPENNALCIGIAVQINFHPDPRHHIAAARFLLGEPEQKTRDEKETRVNTSMDMMHEYMDG